MKTASLLIPVVAILFSASAAAQGKIFRCGNTYTNDEAQAKAMGCKTMEGGNVTVVQGTRVNSAPASAVRPVVAPGSKVDSGEQKARDGEAKAILEAEMKKAEARRAELAREYNNGEPEKLGPETKNHQKYLDRVAELKDAMERNERDIEGLRREISRSSSGSGPK
jgi:hypothetical protein